MDFDAFDHMTVVFWGSLLLAIVLFKTAHILKSGTVSAKIFQYGGGLSAMLAFAALVVAIVSTIGNRQ